MGSGGERPGHRGPDRLGVVLAAEHHDLDHLPSRLAGARALCDPLPEAVEAGGPAAAGALLGEGERSCQRFGLGAQKRRVVAEAGEASVPPPRARPARHRLAFGVDLDLGRADHRLDPAADELAGDRVAVLADRDLRLGVDPDRAALAVVEGLCQPAQPRALSGEQLADRRRAAGDRALEVGLAGCRDQPVELRHVGHLGDGNQVRSAEASDLALDAALLVSAPLAGGAEGRFEQVVGAQGDEALGLDPPSAAHHLGDRGAQVVVADELGGAAEPGEGVDVALEEGELVGALEGADVARSRVAEAQHEQLHGAQLAADHDLRLAEVDLGLRAGLMGLRNGAFCAEAELALEPGDRAADLALGDVGSVLCCQPLVDALGGVALLRWRGEVRVEPVCDQRQVGAELRCAAALGPLALGRQRRRQGLADGAAVDPVAAGELADPRLLPLVVTANRLEQLHSRSHPLCGLPLELRWSPEGSVAVGRGGAK